MVKVLGRDIPNVPHDFDDVGFCRSCRIHSEMYSLTKGRMFFLLSKYCPGKSIAEILEERLAELEGNDGESSS